MLYTATVVISDEQGRFLAPFFIPMETDLVAVIVQTGAVGLLFFVIWAVVFKAMPENRNAITTLQENFIDAVERHEDSHREEVKTIIEGHKEAVSRS